MPMRKEKKKDSPFTVAWVQRELVAPPFKSGGPNFLADHPPRRKNTKGEKGELKVSKVGESFEIQKEHAPPRLWGEKTSSLPSARSRDIGDEATKLAKSSRMKKKVIDVCELFVTFLLIRRGEGSQNKSRFGSSGKQKKERKRRGDEEGGRKGGNGRPLKFASSL